MLDVVRDEFARQAQTWTDTVGQLEHFRATEQAQTLVNALEDLGRLLERIERRLTRLSVEQYATQHGVTADTVRRWVRTNQLPATKGSDGSWSIPYGAVRRKLRKVA